MRRLIKCVPPSANQGASVDLALLQRHLDTELLLFEDSYSSIRGEAVLVSRIVVGNASNPAAAMDGANTGLINSGPQGVAAKSESKGSFSIIVLLCERPRKASRVKVVNLQHEGARI